MQHKCCPIISIDLQAVLWNQPVAAPDKMDVIICGSVMTELYICIPGHYKYAFRDYTDVQVEAKIWNNCNPTVAHLISLWVNPLKYLFLCIWTLQAEMVFFLWLKCSSFKMSSKAYIS